MGTIALVFVCLLFCLAPHPANGADNFRNYCNDRYGFCVDYPERLVTGARPSSGEGGRFYDAGGLIIEATGSSRGSHQTVASEMKLISRGFRKVTHRAKGKDWFALTGYKDAKIVYYKTYIGKASVNQLLIEYPEEKKPQYAKTAARVLRSFKPGATNVPR